MTGYTKLFGSIITSTIWRESKETKILWVTMLALKNKVGIVEGSLPGLADMARLSIEETQAALKVLRSPDPYSRTREFEGRRIEDIDGGWLILNHLKWRNKMTADERRDYLRIKQREHRARVNKSVNKRQQKSTLSTHTDTDAYTNKDVGKNGSSPTANFLADLSKSAAYKGIDVQREFAKAENWCRANKKMLTQRRFVNWLNRVERPFTLSTLTTQVYGKHRLPPPADISEKELAEKRAQVRELSAKLKAELSHQ